MTTELQMLAYSVILGLVQVAIAVSAAIMVRGLPWALGPRDKPMPALEGVPGRLDRAFVNFVHTFPLFAAVVLAGALAGVHNNLTAWGAMLYVGARVVYVFVYAAGLPVVRTLVWTASVVGIVMLLVPLL